MFVQADIHQVSNLHKVSVITTTFNGLPLLPEAVESVLAQTAVSLQYIVVDDGSTDDTVAYLASITDPRLIILLPGRIGRAKALNLALQTAAAPFIANLDADDLMLPGRLARQAEFLAQHPKVGLVGSNALWQTPDGKRQLRSFPPDDVTLRQRLFTGYPFVHSAVMYRQDAVKWAGGFNPALPCALDYDLCCRIAPHAQLANLPEPLVVRRIHGDNFFMQKITPSQYWRALWHIKKDLLAGQRTAVCSLLPRLLATTISSGVRKWQSN